MHHLVYISKALSPFSENDLLNLLIHSRKNNTMEGITGMLLYGNDHFIQLLEGNKEAVTRAFSRIEKDVRHHVEFRLADGPVSQRLFPDWSMGYKVLSQAEFSQFAGFTDPTSNHFLPSGTENNEESILEVLKAFANTNINEIKLV